MSNFINWFERNRKSIGYTVGGLNVLNGILNILLGNGVNGIFWLILGSAIIFDAKMFK